MAGVNRREPECIFKLEMCFRVGYGIGYRKYAFLFSTGYDAMKLGVVCSAREQNISRRMVCIIWDSTRLVFLPAGQKYFPTRRLEALE